MSDDGQPAGISAIDMMNRGMMGNKNSSSDDGGNSEFRQKEQSIGQGAASLAAFATFGVNIASTQHSGYLPQDGQNVGQNISSTAAGMGTLDTRGWLFDVTELFSRLSSGAQADTTANIEAQGDGGARVDTSGSSGDGDYSTSSSTGGDGSSPALNAFHVTDTTEIAAPTNFVTNMTSSRGGDTGRGGGGGEGGGGGGFGLG